MTDLIRVMLAIGAFSALLGIAFNMYEKRGFEDWWRFWEFD